MSSPPSRGEIAAKLRAVEAERQGAVPSDLSDETWDVLARCWWVLPRVPPSLWGDEGDRYVFELARYGRGSTSEPEAWADLEPVESFAAREQQFFLAGFVARVLDGPGSAWTPYFEFESLSCVVPEGFEWPDRDESPRPPLPPSAYSADPADDLAAAVGDDEAEDGAT